MTRELRRLLISPERLRAAPALALEPQELHYLQRVLRLRAGDGFAVVDGCGHLWQARLQQDHARLEDPLDQPQGNEREPQPRLRLALALPRRDADVLLRMVTELGIDSVQPLLSERGVAGGGNRPRQLTIVHEALEQCERLWLPQLAEPCSLGELPAEPPGPCYWATTRQEGLPLLSAVLPQNPGPGAGAIPQQLTVAIGPEGGWSPEEERLAKERGWQAVQLGPTILRSATAAVAAAAVLVSWRAGLAQAAP